MKNYYAILEVPDGSSLEEIRQSYERLLQQHQGDDAALADLLEARDALTAPERWIEPDKTALLSAPVRRCPMGIEAQCPVLLGAVTPGDKFCPECGYLLAGMNTEGGFDTSGLLESNSSEIRLEEPGGRVHRLRPGVTIVGRENADIILADKTVSRQHARLQVTEDSIVTLEDLGSTNGTQVAGDRLVPHVPRPLLEGNRVRFGSVVTELRFPQTAAAAEIVPEQPTAEPAPAQVVEMRDGDGRVFPLVPGVTTFGRRADNTVVLTGDPYVSSSHAQILAAGAMFRLTDVGSTNGTLLNGERLVINESVDLTPGDVILIGGTALRFDLLGSTAAESNAEPTEETALNTDVPAPDATISAEG